MPVTPEEMAQLKRELDELRASVDSGTREFKTMAEDGYFLPSIARLAMVALEGDSFQHVLTSNDLWECDHVISETLALCQIFYLIGRRAAEDGVVVLSQPHYHITSGEDGLP